MKDRPAHLKNKMRRTENQPISQGAENLLQFVKLIEGTESQTTEASLENILSTQYGRKTTSCKCT